MIELGAIFLLALVASTFFSGVEMAFVSGNKLKLRELADGGNRRAGFIMKLHQKQNYFLTAILIGNNVANVAAVSILTYFFQERFGGSSEWLVTVIMAPILIVFAEMAPKDYGRLRAIPFLLSQVFWLKWFYRILYLPIAVFFKIMNLILPSLQKREQRGMFVNEDEFRSLIEESTRKGIVGKQEERLIRTILDFERLQVQAVMIPVAKVPMADIHHKVEDVKRIARETHSKMVLVYEEIPSIVVGMVYVFDILWEENNAKGLHDFLRSPIFISESAPIEKAFLLLQQKRQSYAVVTNPAGNIKGVVPIDRLLMFEKH